MNMNFTKVAFALFSLLFLCSAVLLTGYYVDTGKEQGQLERILEIKNTTLLTSQENKYISLSLTRGEAPDSLSLSTTEITDGAVLPEYLELFELNCDIVGWVMIDGTRVDYPVMQRQREYYLTRGFDRQYSSIGLPFTDKVCDLSDFSENIFIYGHNIKSGAIFHDLLNYKDESFFAENPLIHFDTLYERRTYSVISVMSFIDRDIKDDFTPNSELLVLITCDYYAENGRFAVVAKRID